jgi:drug/metabolite transporter (DMT)-like permease
MSSNTNIVKWVNSKGLAQGIFWIICASFFSNLNDVCTRLAGVTLPAMQITFFRLFFGTIILLPLLLYKGKSSFYIKNKSWHLLRIIIGFGAIACWICGATQTSLPSMTTISFVCPILVLPLAYIFLGEKSDWKRLTAVGLGFIGVVIIAFYEKGAIEQAAGVSLFHPGVVFLFSAAVLFAMSDVLNKKSFFSTILFLFRNRSNWFYSSYLSMETGRLRRIILYVCSRLRWNIYPILYLKGSGCNRDLITYSI